MKTKFRPILSIILSFGALPLLPLAASAQEWASSESLLIAAKTGTPGPAIKSNTHSATAAAAASTTVAPQAPVKHVSLPTSNVEPGGKAIMGKPPTAYKVESQEKIPCLRWADEAVKEPKAILFCIHGMGLHKGCYEEFGKAMAKQGLIVYAIDVRGFGEWVKKEKNDKVDFDGTMSDIKRALVQVRSKNPGLPVIVLGESMGGGIGIHATAQFPELIDGLISSVPAGERYGAGAEKFKVGMQMLMGHGNKVDVGSGVIKQATKKEDLRERWANDPLCRNELSTGELIAFQNFMNKNIEEAALIKDTPVLVIQGAEDKLVIPASTVKLYDSIASFNKSKVLSKTAEHLIFEDGQFNPEDLAYVTNWIDKKIIAKGEDGSNTASTSGSSNSGTTGSTSGTAGSDPPISIHIKPTTPAAAPAATPATAATQVAPSAEALSSPAMDGPSISYWIELYRGGKVYRCNNKIAFQSGDAIRFHIIPKTDGYAYLLMKQGSSGKRAILFPSAKTGNDNYLKSGSDYPVPTADWLSFDNTPGIEKVSILFSHKKMLTGEEYKEPTNLAFVSNDRSGAKDLVPTRMQLSWDDPTPVILPDVIAPSSPGAKQKVSTSDNGSLVKVSFNDPSGLLAVDVALAHQ